MKNINDLPKRKYYVNIKDLVTEGDDVDWCIPVVTDRDYFSTKFNLVESLKIIADGIYTKDEAAEIAKKALDIYYKDHV